ncbi:MAG: hypothetical protein NZ551_07680 [Microscillaceae bacterium]|nr:hypothetical protein [Microscillaceae bacterium]MDW8461076.1 hypothetical protein [Cytophagales bacterium]
MPKFIEQILQRPEFEKQPPVLVDIGASGKIHSWWKPLAPFSICIAFDADKRDFEYIQKQQKKYKKLHIFNQLVADFTTSQVPFYLTQSPHCSSLLEPNLESLQGTFYVDKFRVERIVQLPTIALQQALNELNLEYIDAFKTDSQGIDLRLFKNISPAIRSKILVAEFEPGIIDAYKNEDKLYQILAFMDAEAIFWLASCQIKGSARIEKHELASIFKSKFWQKIAMFAHKPMAGWAELRYFNRLQNSSHFSLRDKLLAWVMATLLQQHGFALQIARIIQTTEPQENITSKLIKYSQKAIRWNVYQLKFYPAVWSKIKQLLGIEP